MKLHAKMVQSWYSRLKCREKPLCKGNYYDEKKLKRMSEGKASDIRFFVNILHQAWRMSEWEKHSRKMQKTAVPSHNTCMAALLSFIKLQHQTGSAKPVQYLH